MEFSDNYLTPQDVFFQKLMERIVVRPDIYLFDLDNDHGKEMYYLLKNPLYSALNDLNVIWIKIDSIDDFYDKLCEIDWKNDNSVLCIPFSWEIGIDDKDIALIEKLFLISREHPIVLTAGSENFNKAFSFCVFADRYITWGTNIDNEDKTITGSSAYACLLAILALGGIGYVKQQKEIIDSIYL